MQEPRKDPPPMRGLYGKAKISVKTLDKVIVLGIAAMLLILFMGMKNRGFTVSFDSRGGTPVEAQKHMYGELVDPPVDPTREGYSFAGWYRDKNYQYPWNMSADKVTETMDLYALWKEK